VAAVGELAAALAGAGLIVEELALRQPTLDDAFLILTGQPPETADETAAEAR
jgi:hypothetical protein